MEKRKKYDFELLQKYCSENNVILLEDYKDDYLTKNFSIKGKCAYENCNNVFEKNFINLIKIEIHILLVLENEPNKHVCF